MTTPSTFQQDADAVRALIGQRNLTPAYEAALVLLRRYPHEVQAYVLMSMIASLNNKGGGARHAANLIDLAAERCGDALTAEIRGDMERDRAVGLIRFAQGNRTDWELAEQVIAQARKLHANDPDRLACLMDVQGRLLYAEGRYHEALEQHRDAEAAWKQLGSSANPVWTYNNWVHWLKATVAVCGGHGYLARTLERRIRHEVPDGAVRRGREALVIRRLPFGLGNRIHDWVTRHR